MIVQGVDPSSYSFDFPMISTDEEQISGEFSHTLGAVLSKSLGLILSVRGDCLLLFPFFE